MRDQRVTIEWHQINNKTKWEVQQRDGKQTTKKDLNRIFRGEEYYDLMEKLNTELQYQACSSRRKNQWACKQINWNHPIRGAKWKQQQQQNNEKEWS